MREAKRSRKVRKEHNCSPFCKPEACSSMVTAAEPKPTARNQELGKIPRTRYTRDAIAHPCRNSLQPASPQLSYYKPEKANITQERGPVSIHLCTGSFDSATKNIAFQTAHQIRLTELSLELSGEKKKKRKKHFRFPWGYLSQN